MWNERGRVRKCFLGSGVEYCGTCLNRVREVIGGYCGTRLDRIRVVNRVYCGTQYLARGG